MSEALHKIESMLGEIERIKKPYGRRRSLFEDPNKTKQEKEKTVTFLDDWNRRWGKRNLDYVNIVQYPDEYMQKVKEEKEMCLNGLVDLIKRSGTLLELSEDFVLILTEDILKADQSATLQNIHSKINKYITDATLFLKEAEIYKRMQQVRLKKNEEEIESFNTYNS